MKDRSAPFSKKHRRYWLPVTGGMILIGMINVALGYCSWPDTPFDRVPERIIPVLPISPFARPDAGPDAGPDGGSLDAAQDAPGDAASDAKSDAGAGAKSDVKSNAEAGAAPAAPRVPAAAPASSAPAPR